MWPKNQDVLAVNLRHPGDASPNQGMPWDPTVDFHFMWANTQDFMPLRTHSYIYIYSWSDPRTCILVGGYTHIYILFVYYNIYIYAYIYIHTILCIFIEFGLV